MARIQVKEGTRYVFKKQIYRVKQALVDNRYLVENLSNSGEDIINHEDLVIAWSKGALQFEVIGTNATQDAETSLKTHYTNDDLADLPKSVQEEAWRRYHLVLAVYRYYRIETVQMLSRRQIAIYVANTEQPDSQPGTSVGTIERYMQSFVDSGGDIRNLVPQTRERGGKDQSRLDEAVERIIATVLEKYAAITERESTVDQVITDIINTIGDENRFRDAREQLILPSERTIRRRIKAAGENRILGRRLSRREQKAQTETESGPRPTRILERVEIDHTVLNLFVVDEKDGLPIGRPYITACIDKYLNP